MMKIGSACSRHVRPHEGACHICKEVLPVTTAWRVGAVVLLGALGASCALQPYTDSADGYATSTGTSTAGPKATSGVGPDTTTTTAATTTANPQSSGELTTTHDVDTSDSGCSSHGGCPSDLPNPTDACDPWIQDCPPGEKCTPYSGDGDLSWDAYKCVPVMDDPGQHGDVCTAGGDGVSGIDSCDLGHMCWWVDPDTGDGVCVKFCTGSPDMPICDVPNAACTIGGPAVLILCLPVCDPLLQNCENFGLCIPDPTRPDEFMCVPDGSGAEGQEFDPCEFANGCDPGLFCLDPALAGECDPTAIGCCIAACDLTTPTCNGQSATCLPWYEPGMAPPGFENVGVCAIP